VNVPAFVVKLIVWPDWPIPPFVSVTVTREVETPSASIVAGETDLSVSTYFVTDTVTLRVVVPAPRRRTATGKV
jgi:hypothetical protein